MQVKHMQQHYIVKRDDAMEKDVCTFAGTAWSYTACATYFEKAGVILNELLREVLVEFS